MADEEPSGELSSGSLQKCAAGNPPNNMDDGAGFIVQVLEAEKKGQGRIKVTVHDNKNSMECLLAPSFNDILEKQGEDGIEPGSILQINGSKLNVIAGHNVLLIEQMNTLQRECEMMHNGSPPPMVKPQSGQKKASFGGARSGFGGSNSGFGGNRASGFGGGGARAPSQRSGGTRYQPVKSLNPFMKDFVIKVKVTSKQPIKEWTNARGSGKLFNVNLIDSESTEIQATGFNDACDRLYPTFEEKKVYIIRKARVKMSNRRYTYIKHEYQLDLQDAEVEVAQDDGNISGMVNFEFKQIGEVEQMNEGYIDLIGVISSVGEVNNFTSKKGNALTKRTFTIMGPPAHSIEATLWGEAINEVDESMTNKVIALKAARVSTFNGKSLTCNMIYKEPKIAEAQTLRDWWSANSGNLGSVTKLSVSTFGGGGRDEPPITAEEAKTKGMKGEDAQEYFNAHLTVTYVPVKSDKPPWYNSCPSQPAEGERKCMKKVMDNGSGGWNCEKCNREYNNYMPRWVLKVKACDHTESCFLSAFDEVATTILGCTAKEAEAMKDMNETEYNAIFTNAVFKEFNMRIRAKMETYQDEARQRLDIVGIKEIEPNQAMTNMAQRTKQLLGMAG